MSGMSRETKMLVSKVGECSIYRHQNRGYDSPDTWFTVQHQRRKIGRDFGFERDAKRYAEEYQDKLGKMTRRQRTVYKLLHQANADSKNPVPVDVGDIKSPTVNALAELGFVDVGLQWHNSRYRVICWLTGHRIETIPA